METAVWPAPDGNPEVAEPGIGFGTPSIFTGKLQPTDSTCLGFQPDDLYMKFASFFLMKHSASAVTLTRGIFDSFWVAWIPNSPCYHFCTMAVNPELLKYLVCPQCKAPLSLTNEGQGLKCAECHRVYPIRDDIPVMMISEATIEN